ncbi:MAG: hypothetical protein GKR95_05490 [Gammaproteobacteria bacterium]|nr:hypothetical protein [Gammaproteobacteria bacterium]
MNNNGEDGVWFPALFIGLGGTGVKTLRYIRWLAEHGGDTKLSDLYRNGQLQLIAVDTDQKENSEEEMVDPYIVGSGQSMVGAALKNNDRLPVVEDYVLLDNQVIQETMENLKCDPARDMNQSFTDNTPEDQIIRKWFPYLNQNKEYGLTEAQAGEGGAAQWRPFGRIAFFKHAHLLRARIVEAVSRLSDATVMGKNLQVHIICSLSGGTGAGCFWDIAFLTNMVLSGRGRKFDLHSAFLLPGAFEELDKAGRIKPNAYACLMELATLKNWRRKDVFKTVYQFGSSIENYEGRPGTMPSFKRIYLYEAFATGGMPPDHGKTALHTTVCKMAENVLARIRYDIYRDIQVGRDNLLTDSNSHPRSVESSYVFGTSTTLALQDDGFESMADGLLRYCLDRVHRSLGKRLYREQRSTSNELSVGDLTISFIEKRLSNLISHRSSRIEKLLYRLRDATIDRRNSSIRKFKMDKFYLEIENRYREFVSEDIGAHWESTISNSRIPVVEENGNMPIYSANIGSLGEIYKEEIGNFWESIDEVLAGLDQTLEENWIVFELGSDTEEILFSLESTLSKWSRMIDILSRDADLRSIEVSAPPEFYLLRYELGILFQNEIYSSMYMEHNARKSARNRNLIVEIFNDMIKGVQNSIIREEQKYQRETVRVEQERFHDEEPV